MPEFRSVLTALGAVALSVAVVFWMVVPVEEDPPPARLRPAQVPEVDSAERQSTPLEGPWRTPPPARAPMVPLNEAPVAVVDQTSLKYLGTVQGTDGTRRFVFKVQSTGRILNLVAGNLDQGWTLTSVDETGFRLSGPGGLYAVAR